MKKMLAMLMVLALMATMCASVALAEGNVIKYSIADDPQQMDPNLNTYSRSSLVLQNLFQGLYKLGPDGSSYIPACAESYEVSEDGMHYSFKLMTLPSASATDAHMVAISARTISRASIFFMEIRLLKRFWSRTDHGTILTEAEMQVKF